MRSTPLIFILIDFTMPSNSSHTCLTGYSPWVFQHRTQTPHLDPCRRLWMPRSREGIHLFKPMTSVRCLLADIPSRAREPKSAVSLIAADYCDPAEDGGIIAIPVDLGRLFGLFRSISPIIGSSRYSRSSTDEPPLVSIAFVIRFHL